MGFAQNLDYLMRKNGLSKYQVAKTIGCHQTSVTNWLENGTVPQKRTLSAVADIFGMSIDEICADNLPESEKKENPTASNGEVLDINNLLERMSTSELADLMGKIAQIMKDR